MLRRFILRRWMSVASLLVLVTVGIAMAAAQEAGSAREIAASLYETGSFVEAANQWEAVARAEPGAIDARINAAQAYLQADDLGRAMLWFRRAQALDPRHSAVQLGLALVRALRVDILGDEPGLLPAVERLSAEVLSRYELAWLTLLAWSAAFGVVTAAFLTHRWKVQAAVIATVATLLLLLAIGREISIGAAPPAVVTAFESTLFSEPGPDGVPLSQIYAGAEARIGARRDGWMLVTLADGRVGWLPDTDVQLLAE